jgi:propionyl-CoA carboxylase alpha chain
MNTRLQVEHPVTEQITGLDLVKLQLKIAEGEKLPFKQEDLKINGHAVEVRVYAEDPTNNFLPDIGTLSTYRRPQGHGIRVDDGFEQGMSIPFYYDPMIAKMICHAENRQQAIQKTLRAIDEYEITGVQTTLGFCKYVLDHEAFTSGNFDTKFVEKYFKPEVLSPKLSDDDATIAAALAVVASQKQARKSNGAGSSQASATSKWKTNRTR